jgi:hypothetical protein
VRSSIHSVVLWLIFLAIPVQGIAAVVVPLRAPAHHAGMAETEGHASGTQLADMHAPAAAGAAAHQDAAVKSAMHADHHEDKAGGGSDHSGHPMLKCCSAACAMAGVMPAATATIRPLTGSTAPLTFLARFYISVTPDGLDRPPKYFLA